MPQALQTLTFFKQALAGGGGFADTLDPGTGDSATFQNVPVGSRAYLAEIWGVDDASPCEFSFTASRFHDQIEGIAGWVPDGSALTPVNRPSLISPQGIDQPVYPSDVMTVRAAGTAGDNVNVTLNVYYADLPGISAVLRTADFVDGQIQNLVGVDVNVTPGSGDWGSSTSLTAAARRLDAGKYYAVLGFTAPTALAALAVSGFETGNLRIGGPVLGEGGHDAYQIYNLATAYQAALIPVVAGNNQDNVLVWAADPAAGATDITVQLGELKSFA
jgi:hypothetical protein